MKKFFCVLFLLALACLETPEAWGAPLKEAAFSEGTEVERQEILAREYQFQISRTPSNEADEREALYLRLITECPATEAAQEAYWVLSNLYLDDMDEPQEGKAREILERFLERYPSSQWGPHVENRLVWLKTR